MALQPPYLDINKATVYQGDTRVFEDLSARFYRGEHTAVLGPNGAGKTTLLKLLTRELYPVVKPNSYVRIDGSEQVKLDQLRQKIGLVSQDLQNRYDAHVFGRDVVLSGLFGAVGMHGHFKVSDAQKQQADSLIARLQLTELQDRRYWHLSTGQQRKFLLARALIHCPQILVLDEPTNGLDLKAAHELLATLRQLAQTGTTLLLVTHHIQEIIPEIKRVILLNQGRIQADGPKSDLLTAHHLSTLYGTPLRLHQEAGYYQVFPGSDLPH